MIRRPAPLRLLLLLVRAVSASPAFTQLFARDNTCVSNGLLSCASQGLPDNLCCSQDTTCVPLAGNTTVLCCPTGSSCDRIRPITCNLAEQNPSTNAKGPIKTTITNAALPTCAKTKLCCPFGFTCSDDGTSCLKEQDQSQQPQADRQLSTTSTTSTTSATSATSTPSGSTSTPPATSTQPFQDTSTPEPSSSSSPSSPSPSGSSKILVIGGAIGGAVALFAILATIICCRRRRNGNHQSSTSKNNTHRQLSGNSASYGSIISAPIMQGDSSIRSDFIRRVRSRRYTTRRSIPKRLSLTTHNEPIPNRFDSPTLCNGSPNISRASLASSDDCHMRAGEVSVARLAPIRSMKATKTHSNRASTHNSQPSPTKDWENVFADPQVEKQGSNANSHNRCTTFSDLVEQANLGDVYRGAAYVPRAQDHGTTHRI